MSGADLRSAIRYAAPLIAALSTAGCGYISGPLPPLANVPSRVADLHAVQRGGTIIAQFTIPLVTTENVTIQEPLHFDLRIATEVNPFSADRWAAQATQVPAPKAAKGTALYEIPSGPWTGKEVTLGVRSIGSNGKPSEWSNFVQVQAVPPPARPSGIRGESVPAGMRLTWKAAGEHFRVLRKTPGEQSFSIIAPDLHTPEFVDTTAAVGVESTYLVQSYLPQGQNREAQSELSDEYKITRQAPPPATPTGLLGVPSSDTIELNWEGNTGAETTGYRIYRSEAGGDYTRIAEVSAVPAYSDHAVQHGKTYRYAVSAIDKEGRESPRSTIVEVGLP
jgi:hypothetical protein